MNWKKRYPLQVFLLVLLPYFLVKALPHPWNYGANVFQVAVLGWLLVDFARAENVAIRRLLCRAIGHSWIRQGRGEPVVSFPECKRCGKWTRFKRSA